MPRVTNTLLFHLNSVLSRLPAPTPSLALALSGGVDSTALALLVARWRQEYSPSTALVAFTVDHQLRPESTKEAQYAGTIASQLEFDHHEILTCDWSAFNAVSSSTSSSSSCGPPPAPPAPLLQQMARHQRYQLMIDACRSHGNVSHLLVAHHEQDQVETFLMRLFRESGLNGLGGMQTCTTFTSTATGGAVDGGHHTNTLSVVRPLLNVPRASLEEMLHENGIDVNTCGENTTPIVEEEETGAGAKQPPQRRPLLPIHDPSNQNLAYDRVRARHAIDAAVSPSLQQALRVLSQDIHLATSSLEQDVDGVFQETCVVVEPCGAVYIHDPQRLCRRGHGHHGSALPKEIALRVLGRAMHCVHGSSPSSSSVQFLPRGQSLDSFQAWMHKVLLLKDPGHQEGHQEGYQEGHARGTGAWATRASSGCSGTLVPDSDVLLQAFRQIGATSDVFQSYAFSKNVLHLQPSQQHVAGKQRARRLSFLPSLWPPTRPRSLPSLSPVLVLTKLGTRQRHGRRKEAATTTIQLNTPFVWNNQWSCTVGTQNTTPNGSNNSNARYVASETLKKRHSSADQSSTRLSHLLMSNMPSIYHVEGTNGCSGRGGVHALGSPLLTPPYKSDAGSSSSSSNSEALRLLALKRL